MNIKLLTQEDWKSWKKIRLEALKNVPEAFDSSFEEESLLSDENFIENLKRSNIFGAFNDSDIIGCVGFYVLPSNKIKHRGMLWGMYVKSEYRGKMAADSLLNAAIQHAKGSVIQLHLTCVTTNISAVKFYQKHGFKVYGTEPRSLKVNSQFSDEFLMVLDLDK